MTHSRYRALPPLFRRIAILFSLIAVVVAIIYIFKLAISIWGWMIVGTGYYHMILAFLIPLAFLYLPATSRQRGKLPWYDVLFSFLCAGFFLYLSFRAWDIMYKGWEVLPPIEVFVMGLIIWALILEAARRAAGWFFFFVVLFFSIYPLFASYMPGILRAQSFSLLRVVGYYMVGPEAVVGLPTQVVATLLIGFLVFGVALISTGAGDFFIDLANALLGKRRAGPAKVAVVGSALVGTISGSVVTNVVTIGSFTIPAMKKIGIPAEMAGAIETCTSTGGVLMPPIMGATAFVLASFLGIPYASVCLAAAIPSILYYASLLIQIDMYAAKRGWKGLPEAPSLKRALKKGWFYIFAFVILIYVLFVMRLEAQAPFIATLVLFITAIISKKMRPSDIYRMFIKFLEDLGKMLGEVTAILVGIGFITGSLFLTGTAQSFSSAVIELAGNNVFLLIALAAITSYILGMGLTVTACYILLAILTGPALIRFGLDPLAAHLFLMYCGMLSYITPPVAIAAYAASTIAQADPIRVGLKAMRIGALLFILPFMFIMRPALILHSSPLDIIYWTVIVMISVILLASCFEGYLWGVGSLDLVTRILLTFCSILVFISCMGIMRAEIIGVVMASLVLSGRVLVKKLKAS